jgi:hypothetical protein
MNRHVELDGEARARMLAFLVLAQLVAEQMVESARIWPQAQRFRCGRLDDARLSRACVAIAAKLARARSSLDAADLAPLFSDGWRVDYAHPFTRHILCCRTGHVAAHSLRSAIAASGTNNGHSGAREKHPQALLNESRLRKTKQPPPFRGG